jgi:hypothetical protein
MYVEAGYNDNQMLEPKMISNSQVGNDGSDMYDML